MYWFSFVFVFNQLTLSLFSKICHRTFVSNSLHPDLVPFREFRFVYGLFLCTTIPPATPCVVSYLLQPALISSAPVASDLFPPPPMCVLQLLFVHFWSFFCVFSCNPTYYTHTQSESPPPRYSGGGGAHATRRRAGSHVEHLGGTLLVRRQADQMPTLS